MEGSLEGMIVGGKERGKERVRGKATKVRVI